MSANVRLWLLPPGNAEAQAYIEESLARVQQSHSKAFSRAMRASADTWLFQWKGINDNEKQMAMATYAAFKRYFGHWPHSYFSASKPAESLNIIFFPKPAPDVMWGRELGEFPWPSEAFASAAPSGRPVSCLATPLGSPPAGHSVSQPKAESCTHEPLFLKAISVLQGEAQTMFGNYAADAGDKQREGTFGKVQRAKSSCVMEVVFKRQKKSDPVEFLKELQVNILLQPHPNVNRILDVIKWDGKLVLVFPAAHLDFFAFLKRKHGLEVCRSFLKPVVAACSHVHARNIIHCDIKPDNFLLQPCDGRADIEGYRLLLADFGEATSTVTSCRELPSRSVVQKHGLQINHWIYRAPELHYGDVAFDCAVDVWSIGCVALEALRGRPWLSGDEKQLTRLLNQHFGGVELQLAFQHLPRLIDNENKLSKSDDLFADVTLSACARRALSAPFVLSPNQRPTALEISRSEWFQDEKKLLVKYVFLAKNGQVVIATGSVSDGCLAKLRKDCLFTSASRQKELELSFDRKP